MRYVIIGNSAAAIGAVQGIRSVDTQGEIVIVSDEKYHTYSRPLISYWLKESVTEENMRYRDAAAVLGKSEAQLTKLVYRGKQSLKTLLEQEGFLYADD